MSLRSLIHVGLLAFAVFLFALHALGAAPRIALVREPGGDARFPRRLRAELDSLGVEVVEVAPVGNGPIHESLEQAARDVGAFAAVRVAPSRGGVEVWIADRVTGKTVLREVVTRQGEANDEIVAVRVVELLRASLLELEMRGVPRGDVKPTRAIRRLVPKRPPAPPAAPEQTSQEPVDLELGPAMAFGGIPASLQLRLGAHFPLSSRFGMHVLVFAPTFPPTIDAAEGHADVALAVFGAGVDVSLLPATAAWRSRVGAGGALAYLRLAGSADQPYSAHAESRLLGAGFARIELTRDLGGKVFLGAELLGGATARRVVVEFANREVASWGQPFGLAAVVLELPLP